MKAIYTKYYFWWGKEQEQMEKWEQLVTVINIVKANYLQRSWP